MGDNKASMPRSPTGVLPFINTLYRIMTLMVCNFLSRISVQTLLNVMWQEWGAWERMNTCMCMAESPHCLPVTITTLKDTYSLEGKF